MIIKDNKYIKNTEKGKIHQLISKGRKQEYFLFKKTDKTFQNELDSGKYFDDILTSINNYEAKILEK
jgi:hypothetical protein